MILAWIIAIGLGMAGILQGAINRQVASQIGVAHGALLGMLLSLFFSAVFFFVVRFSPQSFPPFFQIKMPLTSFEWWYVIPAFFGFCIVSFLPYAIFKLGAVNVSVCLVIAQLITSVFWDIYVEKIQINSMKLTGLAFALLAAIFITMAKRVQ